MELFRISGREHLDKSSDSPLVSRNVPALGLSPRILAKSVNAESQLKCGTPGRYGNYGYHRSPLDRLRNSGLYNLNNSYSSAPHSGVKTIPGRRPGKGLFSFSYAQSQFKAPFDSPRSPVYSPVKTPKSAESVPLEGANCQSFLGDRSLGGNLTPATILNPNKAVVTIDSDGKILTCNDMTSIILGYPEEILCDHMKLTSFIENKKALNIIEQSMEDAKAKMLKMSIENKLIDGKLGGTVPQNKENEDFENSFKTPNKNDTSLPVLMEADVMEREGVVVFSGRIVSLQTKELGSMDVSLWMKRLPMTVTERLPRWLAVMEPIRTIDTMVTINKEGKILSCDCKLPLVLGYSEEEVMTDKNIFEHLNTLKLPENITPKKALSMHCSGFTSEGVTFPLTVKVKQIDQDEYTLDLKMFSTISGLVVVDERGIITDYNQNFARFLLGYGANDLWGKNIGNLLPTYISDMKESCEVNFENDINLKSEESNINLHNKMNSELSSVFCDTISKENSNKCMEKTIESLTEGKNLTDSDKLDQIENLSTATLTREGDEISGYSPNKAFVMSDSQFTLSSSKFSKSESSETDISKLKNKSNIMSMQTPFKSLRDITDSINLLNISEQQNVDESMGPQLMTSTPCVSKVNRKRSLINEGSFFGVAKHKDGADIMVIYQVRKVVINNVSKFCFWILWDPEEANKTPISQLGLTQLCDITGNVSFGQPNHAFKELVDENDVVDARVKKTEPVIEVETEKKDESIVEIASEECEDDSPSSCDSSDFESSDEDSSSEDEYLINTSNVSMSKKENSRLSSCAEETMNRNKNKQNKADMSIFAEPDEKVLISGDYGRDYTILRQIGKGAFGCVKLSYRNTDGLMVITKFIKKDKVANCSWKEDESGRKMPLEIMMLLTFNHPNIVNAICSYENEEYFQLVLEKFGSGMDLFEFIDRNPLMDEQLAAYIFKQIVSALNYLHSKKIVHRDIKDENVIINNEFQIKLIDFGSAAYLEEGKKFSQFAGTVDYCSPEVLKGYKYHGPELEMWTLGITLYTLMYGENPFYDVDEILSQEVILPIKYSNDLCELLTGLLDKNPRSRLTLQEVSESPWTNQEVDMTFYRFEDIVDCSFSEVHPCHYISEYSAISDTSLSTTASSSFAFERRYHSQSLNPESVQKEAKSPLHRSSLSSSGVLCSSDSEDSFINKRLQAEHSNENIHSDTSRTSTSYSINSLRSTVTIDSACLNQSSQEGSTVSALSPRKRDL